MKRTVSSFKPLGAKSCSMSLDQPNSYLEALSAAASASALLTITVLSWSVMQFLRRGYPASRPQAHPGSIRLLRSSAGVRAHFPLARIPGPFLLFLRSCPFLLRPLLLFPPFFSFSLSFPCLFSPPFLFP